MSYRYGFSLIARARGPAISGIVGVLVIGCGAPGRAQETPVWKQLVEAHNDSKLEPVLPDFSYAGYQRGEQAVPAVDYKRFDVTRYGALPDDEVDDEDGIRAAIRAAEVHGEGVVFFPKGRYLVSTSGNKPRHPLVIRKSKIVLRGEGSGPGGTVIFMRDWLDGLSEGPTSSPYLFQFRHETVPPQGLGGKGEKITEVVGPSVRCETFWIEVANPEKLAPGQWIQLKLGPDGNYYGYLEPYDPEPFMTNGVEFEEKHQIDRIDAARVKLKEPIHMDINPAHAWEVWTYPILTGVGVEHIRFLGDWHDDFKHHRSARDDGGWSAVRMDNCVHSWIRDCVFEDCSRSICLWDCAFYSVVRVKIAGEKGGHHGVRAMGGYGVFCGKVDVAQPNHHAPCVGYGSSGTVFWRYRFSGRRGMDAHGNTGYATLLDLVTGGVNPGSNGGHSSVLPNHLRHLVWWNFRNTGPARAELDFWNSSRLRRPYYVKPILVGLHGNPVTFKGGDKQLQLNESPGTKVLPESLYEAQLRLRIGSLPDWLIELKRTSALGKQK